MKALSAVWLMLMIRLLEGKHANHHHISIVENCISLGKVHHDSDCSTPPHNLTTTFDRKFHTLCTNSFKIACLSEKIHSHCENGVKCAKQLNDCQRHPSDASYERCYSACMYGRELKATIGDCKSALRHFDKHTASIVDDCCSSFTDVPINDAAANNEITPEAVEHTKICSTVSVNLCNVNEECVDLASGSYECHCKKGFKLDRKNVCVEAENECPAGYRPSSRTTGGDFECVDIDECETSPCVADTICENTRGSFTCVVTDVLSTNCTEGFRMEKDACVDIDECSEDKCGENDFCTNLHGGFRCEKIECDEGYKNYPRNNCFRKSCRKFNRECSHKPLRVTHFFIVIDRASSEMHKKLLRIESNRVEHYRDFRKLQFNEEFFEARHTKSHAFVVILKRIPTQDQTLKIQMNVRNQKGKLEGRQLYIYHIYVQ